MLRPLSTGPRDPVDVVRIDRIMAINESLES
jgi:hypothetical protein